MKFVRNGLVVAALIGSALCVPAFAAGKVVIGYSAPALLGGKARFRLAS